MTHPLFAVRIWQTGSSWVFPLPKALRDSIGWRPGDLLIIRVHPPYLTLRVAQPESVIPLRTMGLEVLPPAWPGKENHASHQNDSVEEDPAAH